MNTRNVALAIIATLFAFAGTAQAQPSQCRPPHAGEMEQLMDDYIAAFNSNDPAQFGTVLTPDYWTQNPLGVFQGLAAMQGLMAGFYQSLAGLHYEIERVVVVGDVVVLEYSYTATHAGEILGVPASGVVVHGRGMEVHQIQDGLIAATWNYSDVFGLLAQIGAF